MSVPDKWTSDVRSGRDKAVAMSTWNIWALLACIGVTSCGAPVRAESAGATEPARTTQTPEPARSTGASASAVERMQVPGPEGAELARRVGTWNVVSTLRLTPTASPVVTTGLSAERTMIGLYLQEVMKPAPGSSAPDFRRFAYLTYNRVEGRWQYVSLDTRFPVGIMPAYSFGKEQGRDITLVFEPIAFVGFGRDVEGRMVRSNFVITRDTDDHDFGRQYWVQADGEGQEWLAVQYEYTRRR